MCNYLPANSHLPKDKFLDKFYATTLLDYRQIPLSVRLIPWSEYLGIENSSKRISPDRMVWEVLRMYCRQDREGRTRYYFEAVDAVTGDILTPKYIQHTNDIASVSPWAAKGIKCRFPGPDR